MTSFLENPFDDPHISLASLVAFTEDHIPRMTNNNAGGDFTARITATQSSLDLLKEKAAGDLSKEGVREAGVLDKDAYRVSLPGAVAKIAGTVIAQYGDKAPQLKTCFPHGRKVFSDCRDDEVETNLQTLITALTGMQSDLGPQPLAAANTLLTGWLAVFGARVTATGEKDAAMTGKRYARENLQLMLFLNLLKVADVCARQPEKLEQYMKPSLLKPHTPHQHIQAPPPAPPPTPPPAPPHA